MTEYKCSICNYTSNQKKSVSRHINKKKSCGHGTKTIIENSIEIICNFCNKYFSSSISLKYHTKFNCKFKDNIKDEEITHLKQQIKELEKRTTVTTVNNYNTIIMVNNYEDTKFDKLTDKTYNRIIKDADEAYQIIPRLIKEVHFNQNIPENHNIVLSNKNKNNKHLQVYRNNHWEIENKSTEIDNLISDKETNLSDWVAEKGEKYPEAMEKFNEYLDRKYDDEDLLKLVKDEVEKILYNNRHMVHRN